MEIYIIDRDSKVCNQLKKIIDDRELGNVAGMSDDWGEASECVAGKQVDLVLAELALREVSSLDHMQRIHEKMPDTAFIMLSQGNNMELIGKAYEKGAELVLHKPVQTWEIERVLKNMELVKRMKWILRNVCDGSGEVCLAAQGAARISMWGEKIEGNERCGEKEELFLKRQRAVLQEIGILTESGSRDIQRITRYLLENGIQFEDITLNELCCRMNQNTKSVEQRIRRAALAGLANLAGRGMEDYADPAFNEFSGRLYHFEQVRREMNYIRGKSEVRGSVRVRNFMTGLLEYCRED